jgi:hypothetical protein
MAAAARKIAAAADRAQVDEATKVGVGVRAVARQIVAEIEPGSLYWRAPLQYVCEQMAPRVAKQHGIPDAALDDLRAYLLAGLNEYVIALAGDFDGEHFRAWAAAMQAREHEG